MQIPRPGLSDSSQGWGVLGEGACRGGAGRAPVQGPPVERASGGAAGEGAEVLSKDLGRNPEGCGTGVGFGVELWAWALHTGRLWRSEGLLQGHGGGWNKARVDTPGCAGAGITSQTAES